MTATEANETAIHGKRTGLPNRVRQRILIEDYRVNPSNVPARIPDSVWPLLKDRQDDPEALKAILEFVRDGMDDRDAGWAPISLQHWAVATGDLHQTTKLVLHTALRYAQGRQGVYPERVETIAVRAGVSAKTVCRHYRTADAIEEGPPVSVDLRPTDAEKEALDSLRQPPQVDPPERVQAYLKSHGLSHGLPKYPWMRALLEAEFDERSAKAVALAAMVLWGRRGQLFKRTTIDELSELSGYGPDTVTKRLGELEDRWLFRRIKRGRGGGMDLWPRIPDEDRDPREVVERYWGLGPTDRATPGYEAKTPE